MSRNQRLGVVAIVLVVAVAAFVIAKPGDDKKSDSSSSAASTAKQGGTAARKAQVINLTDHAPQGGVQKVKVAKGDQVDFVVTGDKADTIHLHGYNVEKSYKAGGKAAFKFPAKLEGVFEIESHVAEHEGKEPLIGRLYVESS
jgi:hypothetical protein